MKTGARKKTKKGTTEEAYFARFEHEIFNSNNPGETEMKVIHRIPKVQKPNKPMLEHRPAGDYYYEPKTKTVIVTKRK